MSANLAGNELVVIYPIQAAGNYEATPEGFPVRTTEIVTTLDIASLGGGGGPEFEEIVVSGTSAEIFGVDYFVGFVSAASGDKFLTIPASTGTLGQIIVSDCAGTAGTYPITITPTSGSVIGPPNINQVYTNYSTITLLDTSIGWVVT